MAERSDYLYAQVRKKILDAVRMDLIGPTAAEEALTELPTNSYITGMLYPADSDITEDMVCSISLYSSRPCAARAMNSR